MYVTQCYHSYPRNGQNSGTTQMGNGLFPMTNPEELECVCKGNWRIILHEAEPLLGKDFTDGKSIYRFFGLVHGTDDYYYGMYGRDGKTSLLSCVVNLEGHGFKMIEGDPE